jgi:2-polyprenyl-6-methoxyphenol hydroxylase-like FAD-dependent oxidoreductase
MSPIGGVGINLAIQDAVAAANILAPRFLQAGVSDDDLHASNVGARFRRGRRSGCRCSYKTG